MRLGHFLFGLVALCACGADEGPLPLEMLKAHNSVRAHVGVAPLEWSDRLASAAQSWANTLHDQKRLVHQPKMKYGQNLYTIQGGSTTAAQVVNAWAGEEKSYDHRTNKCKG